VDADTLVIAISQSGETYDTLDAIRFAKERGARTAVICNAMGASLTRLVDHAIIQGSGPEICVVSTKAALGQIVVLLRVAAALGRLSGATDQAETVTRDLRALPDAIQQLLDEAPGTSPWRSGTVISVTGSSWAVESTTRWPSSRPSR
jgi:glucosamine--fructose-6-phosphate aminotransferase (isomerizing)